MPDRSRGPRDERLPAVGAALAAALVSLLLLVVFVSPSNVTVPRLGGRSLASAEASLSSIGVKWTVVHLERGPGRGRRQGVVLGQFPPPGATVRKGATIHLTVYGAGLTNGPTVRIPDLIGTLEWRAVNAIIDRGLRVVVSGPQHFGSGYQFWSIVSQSPAPGTALPVGGATVEIRMQAPPAVTVTSRIPASDCASSATRTIHVIAAYTISSAQLRFPPISDGGPLSRQPSGALWRMCYVVGPGAAVSYGFGGSANHALDVFYRNGSLAEVDGQDYPFHFKVVGG